MFIAMNRFKVARGSETAFEQVWTTRDTYLDTVPGFMEFHLLRGPEREDHVLYTSHSVWRSQAAFEDVDPLRGVPPRAPRRRAEQAALSRTSGVRGLRGDPDRPRTLNRPLIRAPRGGKRWRKPGSSISAGAAKARA